MWSDKLGAHRLFSYVSCSLEPFYICWTFPGREHVNCHLGWQVWWAWVMGMITRCLWAETIKWTITNMSWCISNLWPANIFVVSNCILECSQNYEHRVKHLIVTHLFVCISQPKTIRKSKKYLTTPRFKGRHFILFKLTRAGKLSD